VYFQKLKQCPNLDKNATIVCVECVCNLATVHEEFQAFVEYVEYKLLVKIIMGLEVHGRTNGNKKWMNSSTRRWQLGKRPLLFFWNTLHGGGILCTIS
jgi:hypothetical protein